MDHKIQVAKKSKKNGWIIAILILLILAAGGFIWVMHMNQQNRIKSAQSLINRLTVTTTKVKEGVFDLSIDNITGTVRSEQSVDLNWQTSGTVSEIYVKVGDKVRKDDVLAVLDETTLDQDVLNAQLDIEDAQDDYDELVKNSDKIATTLSTLVTAQQALEDAQKKLDSMDMSRVTDVYLTIARDAATAAQLNYDDALRKFDAVRDAPLDSEGRQKALGDVSGYRSVRDNALAEYNWYMGEVDQLELQTREAAVEKAKADLEEAEYQHNKAVQGPTEAELTQAQAKIDAYQKKIDSSKIIAPFDGTVTQLDAKVGDVITYDSSSAARNVFAARIDDISTFYIDFSVSELYINDIKEGQPVTINFAAIPDKVYNGVVSNVSDVGTQSGWNISFDVTVALTDPDEKIKSGMTADIDMLIASIPDAKYVPQTSVISRDGKYFLNVKQADNTLEEVEVGIGMVSGSNVQIISDDIKGGDDIQLKANGETESGWGFPFGMMGGGMMVVPAY